MNRLLDVNLLGLFDLYLISTFILAMVRRYRQYKAVLGLVFDLGQRWPRVVQLVNQHRMIFMTWRTLAPVGITFGLMVVHTLAYNFIWPSARVTPATLLDHRVALAACLLFGAVMCFLDLTAVFARWEFDRGLVEKNLDQAEYWLRSWVSPALRVLTFGFVNPRAMVNDEVRQALLAASGDLNKMFWRWALQIAMRLALGLSLWLTWALLVRQTAQAISMS
jgi:hypothetical protein